MAEYMVLPEEGVVKVPAHLIDEQAASLPCAALTAWSAIVTHDNLGPGSRVLVQGTGGVALFALQFAKLLGCHVTVISLRIRKCEKQSARRRCRDQLLKIPEWYKATREITGGAATTTSSSWAARRRCRSRCAASAPAARCR
jgi:NADPH:quinone reductase-like Zn-dependent oxidoreductase